jgi:ABC-type phosphate/phosphonate transport system substrate-binding protein
VLSALRKAASGADVAVLLDGPQSRSLASLPFAAELEVVARSEPLPSGVIATVGGRVGPERWSALERAFLALPSTEAGKEALAGIQTKEFAKLDGAAREAVQRAAGWGR